MPVGLPVRHVKATQESCAAGVESNLIHSQEGRYIALFDVALSPSIRACRERFNMKTLGQARDGVHDLRQTTGSASLTRKYPCRTSTRPRALLSRNVQQYSNGAANGNGHSGHTATWSPSAGSPSLAQPPQQADTPLLALLKQVAANNLQPEEAVTLLQREALGPQQENALAEVRQTDGHRLPEIVWAPGKTPAQISVVMRQAAAADSSTLAVRIDPDVAAAVMRDLPDATYNQAARTLRWRSEIARKAQKRLAGTIAVVGAATADPMIAEECRAVADAMGCYAFRLPDVSVDRLNGILGSAGAVRAASVVVVITGADGALPSILSGLVSAPVIAVPSLGGPGAALPGTTALAGALAAATAGVAVSHADSGIGAALLAARILRCADRLRSPTPTA
ncbi:hypothetical protein WJX73_010265 [Symbiochloris irregularis]|uniref:phosphoribosylaminoimidazole carboxylase n=1 Tax=Symbiochloris irregularis TaxID=706552 RepID=A0AAW1NU23_9CHLO